MKRLLMLTGFLLLFAGGQCFAMPVLNTLPEVFSGSLWGMSSAKVAEELDCELSFAGKKVENVMYTHTAGQVLFAAHKWDVYLAFDDDQLDRVALVYSGGRDWHKAYMEAEVALTHEYGRPLDDVMVHEMPSVVQVASWHTRTSIVLLTKYTTHNVAPSSDLVIRFTRRTAGLKSDS